MKRQRKFLEYNYDQSKIDQQHLPDEIKDHVFYHPTEHGHEKKIKEWLKR